MSDIERIKQEADRLRELLASARNAAQQIREAGGLICVMGDVLSDYICQPNNTLIAHDCVRVTVHI